MAENILEDIDELSYGKETEEVPNEPSNIKKVLTRLNCRNTPNGNIVKVYEAGTIVEVLDVDDGWVKTPDGWVMEQYLG